MPKRDERYYVVTIREDGSRSVFGPFDREEAKRQAAAHRNQMGMRARVVMVKRGKKAAYG